MNFINAFKKLGMKFSNPKEKEVKKMKKNIISLLVLISAVLFAANAFADTHTDKTVSVSASATIAGVTSLSVSPATMTYTATNIDQFAQTPKLTVTYGSNYNPWKIDIYTNNIQVPLKAATNGLAQKGGLVAGTGPYSIIPMKWVATNPSTTPPNATTISWQTAYNFVKDIRDEESVAGDKSDWTTSFNGGYANIAYGSGANGVCVDPTNSAGGFKGDPITGTIAVYVAGLFATGGVTPAVAATQGDYSTSVGFDLYHP